jgi:hypothetical protein
MSDNTGPDVPLSIIRQREEKCTNPEPDKVTATATVGETNQFVVECDNITSEEVVASVKSHVRYSGEEVAIVEIRSSGELDGWLICFPRVLGREDLHIPRCIRRIMLSMVPSGTEVIDRDWDSGYMRIYEFADSTTPLEFISDYKSLGELLDMCKDNHE